MRKEYKYSNLKKETNRLYQHISTTNKSGYRLNKQSMKTWITL